MEAVYSTPKNNTSWNMVIQGTLISTLAWSRPSQLAELSCSKGAGSFHILRKTMKDLCALAVLGIWEWPNLAQNLVTHWHWWKNISRAMTLPFKRVFGQNLAIFAHFWAFSVTFLVVTAINMLTLGTGRTCIFYGHIPSWFEAVLAIAMLQSWTRGPQKWVIFGSKSGHNGRVGLGQGSIVGTL